MEEKNKAEITWLLLQSRMTTLLNIIKDLLAVYEAMQRDISDIKKGLGIEEELC